MDLKKIILYLGLCIIPLQMNAAGNVMHEGSTGHDTTVAAVAEAHEAAGPAGEERAGSLFVRFEEFPNLHPLIVHFPVVLLLLAFFSQLTGLFVYREPFSWVTMALLAGGFIGAVLAAHVFHADAEGLSEEAQRIFETHEALAGWTTWLAGIGLLCKAASHFLLKRKLWAEVVVLVLVAAVAVSVSLTGHLGSEMVYIENIGPGGHHVEKHHEE
jgi:uncharacterized membrane protein